MKRCCLLVLIFCLLSVCASAEVLPVRNYDAVDKKGTSVMKYDGSTLKFSIKRIMHEGAACYLTKIWMQNPAQQIGKAMSPWQETLWKPSAMVEKKPEVMLAVNASGFFSATFQDMPETYPGTKESYFNTSWGTLVITDSTVLRDLEELTFTGLALTENGLQMYRDVPHETVLADAPTQTFAFRDTCCILHDGTVDTAEDKFALGSYIRVVIGKVDANNYLLLVVTSESNSGLPLKETAELMQRYGCEWAFNLDGGPSCALLAKRTKKSDMRIITGNRTRVIDAMTFSELDE